MCFWGFQESASGPKYPQVLKFPLALRPSGKKNKCRRFSVASGPCSVRIRLFWGVVSHRVYIAAIFSETKFLPQVLLLPICSKCRRPAVGRSSYWTKALSRRRHQSGEMEQSSQILGRWLCLTFSLSPEEEDPLERKVLTYPVVGFPLHYDRNLIHRWHQRGKMEKLAALSLSFLSPINNTDTCRHTSVQQVLQIKSTPWSDLRLKSPLYQARNERMKRICV